MNIAILSSACAIAIIRPVWGILLLFVLESSLFNLGELYATVQLPIGFASPMDVLIFAILLGALLHRHARLNTLAFCQPASAMLRSPASHDIRRFLTRTLLPYVGWTAIAITLAVAFDADFRSNTTAFRGALSAILPWFLVPIIWLIRDRAPQLIKGILIIATATSAAHVIIQMFDLRSLMAAAYHYGDAASAVMQWRQHEVETAVVVRGLPQGPYLILFTATVLLARLLASTKHRPIWLASALGIQVAAIIITVTRSLTLLLVISFVMTLFLARLYRVVGPRTAVRTLVGGTLAIALGAGGLIISPRYQQLWADRLNEAQQDSAIFTPATVRGLNNLASLDAIMARPIRGYGFLDYPDAFSYIGSHHSDIHPLLSVMLCSGIPGLALLLYALVRFTLRSIRYCKAHRAHAAVILPYSSIFAITLLINSLGAGGTLESRGLLSFALFLGLFAANVATLPNPRHRQNLSISTVAAPQLVGASQ